MVCEMFLFFFRSYHRFVCTRVGLGGTAGFFVAAGLGVAATPFEGPFAPCRLTLGLGNSGGFGFGGGVGGGGFRFCC